MLDRPCKTQQQAPWTSSNEQTDSRTLSSLSQIAGCESVLPAQSFNDTMTQQTKQANSLSEHENETLNAQADMLDRPCRIQQKASSTSSIEQTELRSYRDWETNHSI